MKHFLGVQTLFVSTTVRAELCGTSDNTAVSSSGQEWQVTTRSEVTIDDTTVISLREIFPFNNGRLFFQRKD